MEALAVEASDKAEILRRRREQQKQWQQRYRDQTKYLTSRVLPFLPRLAAGKMYPETELLEKLVDAVKAAKAKPSGTSEAGGSESAKRAGAGALGLTFGSAVDTHAVVSGLGLSVDPLFVLGSGTQDPRLAISTVRWCEEHAITLEDTRSLTLRASAAGSHCGVWPSRRGCTVEHRVR